MDMVQWISDIVRYALSMSRNITTFVYDAVGMLDVVGPTDVFSIANQRAGQRLYDMNVVAMGRQRTVRAESGLRLAVDECIDRVSDCHTLLLPGGDGCQALLSQPRVIAQIRRLAEHSQRVASVCTGAFLLAEAGLLNQRQATTHWAHAAQLAESYPAVDVVPDALYITSDKYTTSGGIASGIDLALGLLADDHGADLARETSQRMVLYLNRTGGQSQFSERQTNRAESTDPFDRLLASIAARPSANHGNAALANRLSVGERQFSRIFHQRTGTSPARWVERVRVDHARRLLETGDWPMPEIARRSGFASVDTLRQAFKRVMGLPPSQYRLHHGVKGRSAVSG